MAVYLVTWEINRAKVYYTTAREKFIAQLQRHSYTKDQGLDSVAFVSTHLSAQALSDDLQMALDDNDRLMVVKLSNGNHQGWLDKPIWDWINARLS